MGWVSKLADWSPLDNDSQWGAWNNGAWELAGDAPFFWLVPSGSWATGYRADTLRITLSITTADDPFTVETEIRCVDDWFNTTTESKSPGSSSYEVSLLSRYVPTPPFGGYTLPDMSGDINKLAVWVASDNATLSRITNIEFYEDASNAYGTIEAGVALDGAGAGIGTGSISAAVALSGASGGASIGSATSDVALAGAGVAGQPVVAKRVARTRYTLVVTDTGTQEGMALPMSYLSVASRSGAPSAVTAVVPYVAPLADWLSGLAAARLDVYRSQTDHTGATSTALVQTATLDSLRQDIGAKNASITLTAHATLTCRAPKYVTLNGLSYLAVTDGKTRVRCAPSNDLAVGDTVAIEGRTLAANLIQLTVSPTLELMEVSD